MSLWVVAPRPGEGGVVEAWPRGGPSAEQWLSGTSLRPFASAQFAVGLAPDVKRKELLDFQPNRVGALLVSQKARGVLEGLGLPNVELYPATIKDQKGKVLSRDYTLVHLLGLEDAIDLARSKATFAPGSPGRLERLERLAIAPRRVHPSAHLFRCAALPSLVLARADVREAVLAARLTGVSFEFAEGYAG